MKKVILVTMVLITSMASARNRYGYSVQSNEQFQAEDVAQEQQQDSIVESEIKIIEPDLLEPMGGRDVRDLFLVWEHYDCKGKIEFFGNAPGAVVRLSFSGLGSTESEAVESSQVLTKIEKVCTANPYLTGVSVGRCDHTRLVEYVPGYWQPFQILGETNTYEFSCKYNQQQNH